MQSQLADGPKGRFFVGSLPERKKDPIGFFLNSAKQYGKIVRYKMGPVIVHLLNDPDYIKYVLQDNAKNYVKGFGYDKLMPLLGTGLLTSEGEFWRTQRKLAQPAFHRQRIASFANTMTKAASDMLDRWDHRPNQNEPIDIAHEMMKLTMRIVGETLLSADVTNDADVVGKALGVLIPEANRRILSLLQIWAKLPTPRNQRYQKALDDLNHIVFRIIEERRKSGEDKGDLLSMLMAARDEDTGEGMTNKQLRDEVMTIFLAGHETTANALAWTWYLLSKNPSVTRKLKQEVDEVLGGRTPTFEDVPKLKYTLMVIEESMRLYPPAWIIARAAIQDDVIGGYSIPKGSTVVASAYVMHRNPEYWKNPEGFDPERFLPENSAARPKYAYFPFSGGPRQCIGNNFALMEAQLIVAMIVQRYDLHLVPGHKVEPEPLITLRPKYGVQMTLHPR